MQQLLAYLAGEKQAARETEEIAKKSKLLSLNNDVEGETPTRNWYALMWIASNAVLSFIANLVFAFRLGIHPVASVILAILFVFAPAFALSICKRVWRYIQKPGNWSRDAALIFLMLLSLAPMGISWIATVALLSGVLVFEFSLTTLAIYFIAAVATDLPQIVYFLNKR